MADDVSKLIRDARVSGASELDLAGTQLEALPPEIGQLSSLRKLDLSSTGLELLPVELGHLVDLEDLDVSSNELVPAAGEVLERLVGLKRLDVSFNYRLTFDWIASLRQLEYLEMLGVEFPEAPLEIAELSRLEYLGLGSNGLTAIPDEFGRLTSLKVLWLWGNSLSEVPPAARTMARLTTARLDDNPVKTMPGWLAELSQLERLMFRATELESIPGSLGSLPRMRELQLDGSKITDLPDGLRRAKRLTHLSLARNRLARVPDWIGDLDALEELDVSGNQLTQLPESLGRLRNLIRLNVSGNPVRDLPRTLIDLPRLTSLHVDETEIQVPPEIAASENAERILRYYTDLLTGDRRPLNEAKVILVGQGGVGKTSLVKALTGVEFDPREDKTPGIAITQWETEVGDERVRLNIWDFGGQEIMHATHQFFLTRRSLYLLVADARLSEDQNRLEYWLKLIQSFGGASPVIVVGNKSDQHPFDVDRRGLMNKYESIRAISDASCASGAGIDQVRALISESVSEMPHVGDQLLVSWFAVKERLETLDKDYLPYSDFVAMCHAEGIGDETSQRTLIRFLHDLGVVVNFQDDPRLEETNILNPDWVTSGVYGILNSNQLFQQRGVLNLADLGTILDPARFPPAKHLFIVDVMRRFELCFDFEGFRDQRFLVPDLLPREEPATGDWSGSLEFEYHYEVLPDSVISRFIVRMHAHISKGTYWRSGVVLERGGATALVRADRTDARMRISVRGPEGRRRELLSVIRSEFEVIHQSIPGLVPTEYVRLPHRPDVLVDYSHLLGLESLGESSFVPVGLSEHVSVQALLSGVETRAERRLRAQDGGSAEPRDEPLEAVGVATPAPEGRAGPWISGLFYLLCFVVAVALVAALVKVLPWYAVPFVLVGGLIAVFLVGVFQLRQDERIQDKTFGELAGQVLTQIAQLGRADHGARPLESGGMRPEENAPPGQGPQP